MKILCTGDIHLGRQPSRVGDHVDGRSISPAAAWAAMVECAITRDVELVLLSGDVIDRDNRFYEAIGALERGLVRLGEAGIRVAAVSGNHDFDVLPRVVRTLGEDRLHLLGRDGQWERATFDLPSGRIHVDGWSFPAQHVQQSPLTTYPAHLADDAPLLVLLHGDLDQPASDYAPLDRADLARLPAAACVLGHIHKPMIDRPATGPLVMYPGSPQPLDPGETGPHGPVLLTLDATGHLSAAQPVPEIATLRYEPVTVDLAGVDQMTGVDQRLFDALRTTAERAAAEGPAVEHLRCRVHLTGRTAVHRELRSHMDQATADLNLPHGSLTATIEKVTFGTAPAIDLPDLARGRDATAILARTLLSLRDGEAAGHTALDIDPLLQSCRSAIHDLHQSKAYRDLDDAGASPDAAAVRDLAYEQGLLLLDELLAQKADSKPLSPSAERRGDGGLPAGEGASP